MRTMAIGGWSEVTSVAFATDGAFIASGSSDETVKVWSVDEPKKPNEIYRDLIEKIDILDLRQLVRDYTHRYDKIIGRWLFKREIKQYEGSPKITKNQICRHIFALDLAFTLVVPLQSETIVYRGSDKNDLKRRHIINRKWTHKSYLSTTLNLETFSTGDFLDLDGDCCIDQIIIPKGMRVLPLFDDLSNYPTECELLLPRNTTFIELTFPQKVYYDELDMELVTSFWKIDTRDETDTEVSTQPQLNFKSGVRKILPRLKL